MRAKLILTAALVAMAGGALADDDDGCRNVPKEKRLAIEAIAEKARAMGLTVRKIEMDDGCYEVHAFGARGDRIELHLDPVTAELLSVDDD